ncbi:MAG: uroporphyrinogen decarboxylase [Candidatus Sumerlaeia bacterium]|nr:uroporphyrinogen decarboxylase [Candidatus Sumerlaeia bacterium]
MPASALSKTERFLLTIRGEQTDRPPVWIMRQAGRYMPEYMRLREAHSFRDLCLDPEVSSSAALLPLELLDVDILIIFNDILIPLEAMGLTVDFPDGGPRIADPPRTEADLERFRAVTFQNPPVAHALRRLRERSGGELPILGFAGSPFTLLGYAVEGRLSKNCDVIRGLMLEQPALAHAMLDRIADTVVSYLVAQVADGGATAVQVFESLGHILSPWDLEEFATAYTRRVIQRFRAACPDTPVIAFARSSAASIEAMERTGADVLGIDWSIRLADARARTTRPLQGNLDPLVMIAPDAVEREFERMIEGFDWRRGWIANLGHGITPQAKVEAARRLVQCVQRLADR